MSGADNAETPFKRFRKLAAKLTSVPKREVEQQRLVKAAAKARLTKRERT